jgi:carboxypeptidase Taq
VTRRDYEKQTKIPAELASEMARARALGQEAWVQARAESDFARFLPYLDKNVDLKFKYIECLDEGQATPYDILLDDYEPGMKTAEVQTCFDALKKELIPLISAIGEKQESVSDACLYGDFPLETQTSFCRSLLTQLGASWESWRLDPTVHPFASGSQQDIRITTRYHADHLSPSLFATMHEFGHGLYEHQVSPALQRTPLSRGTSMAIHESQSRTWENLVGRSRAFCRYLYPQVQATFQGHFANVSQEEFYRAINKVQPSFIRVEADEATYALHIILRFELEQEMITGKLDLKDLPAIWNARFKEYFGLPVPNDAQGVLQDVHWAFGGMGYFPTYALGSIVACQLWEKIETDIADLALSIAHGEFGALREWMRVNLHQYGRKFTSSELLQRVVGSGIQVEPFIRYLQGKYGEIYGLNRQSSNDLAA